MGMLRETCHAGAVLEQGKLTFYPDLEDAIAAHMVNMQQAQTG